MQNIPSHADDIRHMFRATPGYVMLSSDYSAQEPRLTAFVSGDEKMTEAFKNDRDVYASIASEAFRQPYEKCLEFHPVTGEYQPDGKARRSEAKTILLGILYGRSVPSIADQLYGNRDDMSDDDKIKNATNVYNSVLTAFPKLRNAMNNAQSMARKLGYTTTILGRRRHIPDMQLKEFEFRALSNYVNPDVDPLDIKTLKDKSEIPQRIVDDLTREFKGYKYFGQIANRQRELYDEGIKVYNNRKKINDASRKCLNGIIQGSAADMTKMAILMLENNKDWKSLGGRLLVPVHDELIAEVPMEYWKEGGELLSSIMVEAANFLPFKSKCDVTTTLRWYGVDYPCKYDKPNPLTSFEDLQSLSESEMRWIQWHLYDLEYDLPVYKNEDGSKPIGDDALGINGIYFEDLDKYLSEYCYKYKISLEEFIEHIDYFVINGVLKN